MAIITIFGLAGTGTSSCGKLLANKLGYEFMSTGGLFRLQAEELGLTLHEYEKNINNNPQKDREFDQKIEKLGQEKDNLVIDSRLAWHFIPGSIKIKFHCMDQIRLRRISERDKVSQEEAEHKTFFREMSHMNRYKQTYGLVDYTADEHFDFIIETSSLTPSEIVDEIIKKINSL
jgi:cytidylate kinase